MEKESLWEDSGKIQLQSHAFLWFPALAGEKGGDEMSDENLILGFVVCVERCVLFPPCMFA